MWMVSCLQRLVFNLREYSHFVCLVSIFKADLVTCSTRERWYNLRGKSPDYEVIFAAEDFITYTRLTKEQKQPWQATFERKWCLKISYLWISKCISMVMQNTWKETLMSRPGTWFTIFYLYKTFSERQIYIFQKQGDSNTLSRCLPNEC